MTVTVWDYIYFFVTVTRKQNNFKGTHYIISLDCNFLTVFTLTNNAVHIEYSY